LRKKVAEDSNTRDRREREEEKRENANDNTIAPRQDRDWASSRPFGPEGGPPFHDVKGSAGVQPGRYAQGEGCFR